LPLIGATLEVVSGDDIAVAMCLLLSKRIPGLDWWVPDHWSAALVKYPIVHHCFSAPPNSITGEAMALEVFGTAERDPETRSIEWMEARIRWWERSSPHVEQPSVVRFPAKFTIEVATYANVAYPGVRVPLYM